MLIWNANRSNSHGRFHDDEISFERERGDRRRLEGVHRGQGGYESENRELALIDTRDPRRYVKQDDPKERLWTEITEDLVSEEAIKEKGYEYTKTGGFFYVYKYLKYVSRSFDILRLFFGTHHARVFDPS